MFEFLADEVKQIAQPYITTDLIEIRNAKISFVAHNRNI